MDYEKEQHIIQEYKNGSSKQFIAKTLKISERTVKKVLEKHNIPTIASDKRKLYFYPEDIIKKYTQENMSSFEIGKVYGVSDKVIIRILEFNKIPIKKHGQKTYRNEDYFKEINCEEKAYLLGLLRSDGNVLDTGTISLVQSAERKDLIEKVAKILNVPCLYFDKRDEYRISFRQKSWVEDLEKYGITPRKSLENPGLRVDKIPNEFIHHYLRGLFDGDGLCYFNQGNLILGFCSGHKQDIEDFIKAINYPGLKIYHGSVYFTSKSNLKWVSYFYDFIYKDATIWGDLKKSRIEECLNKKIPS